MTSIMCLVLVLGGPILVANAIEATQPLTHNNERISEWIATAALPPLAWVRLAAGWPERHQETTGDITAIVAGAAAYALCSWLLWQMARRQLRG
jgi:hypothetical protein